MISKPNEGAVLASSLFRALGIHLTVAQSDQKNLRYAILQARSIDEPGSVLIDADKSIVDDDPLAPGQGQWYLSENRNHERSACPT
jgi:hypothetical protein